MQPTPVAVFTYNRPEHARRALTSLAQCNRLTECQVYIYCDGARSAAHQASVEASRQTVHELAGSLNARVVERAENLGLAHSIVTAVTELVQAYGRVIVVEDDLILSPSFLDFMLQALDKYQEAEQVFQIAGYTFPVELATPLGCFFLPMISTWGWATWERAWQYFDWHPKLAHELLLEPGERRRFDLDGSYPYSAMLDDRLTGKNDSWGILWWHAVFQQSGKALFPVKSLVRNAGFDGTGTHSGNSQTLSQSLHTEVAGVTISRPLRFPTTTDIDLAVWATIKDYLKNQQQQLRARPVLQRAWRRIKVLMNWRAP